MPRSLVCCSVRLFRHLSSQLRADQRVCFRLRQLRVDREYSTGRLPSAGPGYHFYESIKYPKLFFSHLILFYSDFPGSHSAYRLLPSSLVVEHGDVTLGGHLRDGNSPRPVPRQHSFSLLSSARKNPGRLFLSLLRSERRG